MINTSEQMDYSDVQKTLRQFISSLYHRAGTNNRCPCKVCAIGSKRDSGLLPQPTRRTKIRRPSSGSVVTVRDPFAQRMSVIQTTENTKWKIWKNFGTPWLDRTTPNTDPEENDSGRDGAVCSTRSGSISPQTDGTLGLPDDVCTELTFADCDQSADIRACFVRLSDDCEFPQARKKYSELTRDSLILAIDRPLVNLKCTLRDAVDTDCNSPPRNIEHDCKFTGSCYSFKRFIHYGTNEDQYRYKKFTDMRPEICIGKLWTEPQSMTNIPYDRFQTCKPKPRKQQHNMPRSRSTTLVPCTIAADTPTIGSTLFVEENHPINKYSWRFPSNSWQVQTPAGLDFQNAPRRSTNNQNTQTGNKGIIIPLTIRAPYMIPLQTSTLQLTSSTVIKIIPECGAVDESNTGLTQTRTKIQPPPARVSSSSVQTTEVTSVHSSSSTSCRKSGSFWLCGARRRDKPCDPVTTKSPTRPSTNEIKSLGYLGCAKWPCGKRAHRRREAPRNPRNVELGWSSGRNLQSVGESVPSAVSRSVAKASIPVLTADQSKPNYERNEIDHSVSAPLLLTQHSYESSATDSHNDYKESKTVNSNKKERPSLPDQTSRTSLINSRYEDRRISEQQRRETFTVAGGQRISSSGRSYGSVRISTSPVRFDTNPSDDRVIVDVQLQPDDVPAYSRPDLANVDIVVRASLLRQHPQTPLPGLRPQDPNQTAGGVWRAGRISMSTPKQAAEEDKGTWGINEPGFSKNPLHLADTSIQNSDIRTDPFTNPQLPRRSNRQSESNTPVVQEILVEVEEEPLRVSLTGADWEDTRTSDSINLHNRKQATEDDQQTYSDYLEGARNVTSSTITLKEDKIDPMVQRVSRKEGEISISHKPKLSEVTSNQKNYDVDFKSSPQQNLSIESKPTSQNMQQDVHTAQSSRGGKETETPSCETSIPQTSSNTGIQSSHRKSVQERTEELNNTVISEPPIVCSVVDRHKPSTVSDWQKPNRENRSENSRVMQAKDHVTTVRPVPQADLESVVPDVEQEGTVEGLKSSTEPEPEISPTEGEGLSRENRCGSTAKLVQGSPQRPDIVVLVRTSSEQLSETDTAAGNVTQELMELSKPIEHTAINPTISDQVACESVLFIPSADRLTHARSHSVSREKPKRALKRSQPAEIAEQQMQLKDSSFIIPISDRHSEQATVEPVAQIPGASGAFVQSIHSMLPARVVTQQSDVPTTPTTTVNSEFSEFLDLMDSLSDAVKQESPVSQFSITTKNVKKGLSKEMSQIGFISQSHGPITEQPQKSVESRLDAEEEKELPINRFQLSIDKQSEPNGASQRRENLYHSPPQGTRNSSTWYPNQVHELPPKASLSLKKQFIVDHPNLNISTRYPHYPTIGATDTQPEYITGFSSPEPAVGKPSSSVLRIQERAEAKWPDSFSREIRSPPATWYSSDSGPQCLCLRSSQCPRYGPVLRCSSNYQSKPLLVQCSCRGSHATRPVYTKQALYPYCYESRANRHEPWNVPFGRTSCVQNNRINLSQSQCCCSPSLTHMLRSAQIELTTPQIINTTPACLYKTEPTFIRDYNSPRVSLVTQQQQRTPRGYCCCCLQSPSFRYVISRGGACCHPGMGSTGRTA